MTASINVDQQQRYLVQWFKEWSELQRTDFLPVLAEKYSNAAYVNGIVNSISGVNCRDKPMSLFECRVKLFREWFTQWSMEQKDNFLKQISDIDDTFADKLKSELENGVSHYNHNGVEGLEDD